MEVQWKNILDSNYDVSNTGQIRNRKSQRLLKQQFNHKGYPVITIYVGDRKRTLFVHRLVAMAFIRPVDMVDINTHRVVKHYESVRKAARAIGGVSSRIS